MARPARPTLAAAKKQSSPAPLPRSSTTSPGCSCALTSGLPHPRPRFASGGTSASSSGVYPTLTDISPAPRSPVRMVPSFSSRAIFR